VAATAHEVNFDGLVGPTHNYAGLSRGNLASQRSKHSVSNPRAAALEGLAKMKLVSDLGVRQAVLPPHERPDVGALRRLGFTGSDADVLWKARRDDPALLAACCSASATRPTAACISRRPTSCLSVTGHWSRRRPAGSSARSLPTRATSCITNS
jgi:succinylarginine dihydrolase